MIGQHSHCKKRDTALLLVLFSTAAKPLEIARLEVSDYLSEDGSVREASVLRADAAINGKERPLFFVSTKVVVAVDAYLEERIRRGQAPKKSTKYRGLDRHSFTNSLKKPQMSEYGYPLSDIRDFEEDHLVPLCLAAAPQDRANLWPQPCFGE